MNKVVVLVAMCAAVLAPAADAAAQARGLRLTPEYPEAGATIQMAYAPVAALAGAERLRVRARYRTAEETMPPMQLTHVTVGTLSRSADGGYHGSFTLPPDVVYAVLAVEDEGARHVDAGGDAPYELLVSDGTGRPLLASLVQKRRDLATWHAELALAATRRMTEVYPDSLVSWVNRSQVELSVAAPGHAGELRAAFAERLRHFSSMHRDVQHVPGETMMLLSVGLSVVRDTAESRYWDERLQRTEPTHWQPVGQRVSALAAEFRGRNAELLQALDQLYTEAGPGSVQLVDVGYRVADAAQDAAALRLWIERWVSMQPHMASGLARAMLRYPELRAEGTARIEEFIRQREQYADADRLLVETRAEQRSRIRPGIASLRAALGEAYVQAGDVATGRALLHAAADAVWDPAVFRSAATATLALGDTAAAGELLARVAVDPLTRPTFVDSAMARVGVRAEDANWTSWLSSARQRLVTQVLAEGYDQPLSGATLLSRDGSAIDMRELLVSGTPAVVAIWSRYCPISLMQLPQLNALAAGWAGQGTQVITITTDSPSDGFESFLTERSLTFPVFFDTGREAVRVMAAAGTPTYFVLDERGHIRFRGHRLDEVQRRLAVLQMGRSSAQ